MKPVATLTSMHICPMCTGTVPHVGGPVIGPGQPNILMNGKPVAVMGDMCTCSGPPDTIVMGNPSILMNGVPVACMGDMTAHGGSIVMGEPNILMGSATPKPSAIMPVKEIPFPKINVVDRTVAKMSGNGGKLKEAEKNQQAIKKQAETQKNPIKLSNLQWKKDGATVSKAIAGDELTACADVSNAEDGAIIQLKVFDAKYTKFRDALDTLHGEVENSKIEIPWKASYTRRLSEEEEDDYTKEDGYPLPKCVFKFLNCEEEQTSGKLELADSIEFSVTDDKTEEALANGKYTITMPDGNLKEGQLDENGYALIENLHPGKHFSVFFNEENRPLDAIKSK